MIKREILSLPVSAKSWILLRDDLSRYWEEDVFQKIIEDYYEDIPLFEVNNLFTEAEKMLAEETFRRMLELLFRKNARQTNFRRRLFSDYCS